MLQGAVPPSSLDLLSGPIFSKKGKYSLFQFSCLAREPQK